MPVLLTTTVPVQATDYVNPLPHVLTLTAIVVGVATLGSHWHCVPRCIGDMEVLTRKKF